MESFRLVATGPGCQSVCQVYVQLGQKGLKKTLLRGPVPQGDRGWGKWFCFVATGRGCQCVKCVYNWNRRDVRVRALGTVCVCGGSFCLAATRLAYLHQRICQVTTQRRQLTIQHHTRVDSAAVRKSKLPVSAVSNQVFYVCIGS